MLLTLDVLYTLLNKLIALLRFPLIQSESQSFMPDTHKKLVDLRLAIFTAAERLTECEGAADLQDKVKPALNNAIRLRNICYSSTYTLKSTPELHALSKQLDIIRTSYLERKKAYPQLQAQQESRAQHLMPNPISHAGRGLHLFGNTRCLGIGTATELAQQHPDQVSTLLCGDRGLYNKFIEAQKQLHPAKPCYK